MTVSMVEKLGKPLGFKTGSLLDLKQIPALKLAVSTEGGPSSQCNPDKSRANQAHQDVNGNIIALRIDATY